MYNLPNNYFKKFILNDVPGGPRDEQEKQRAKFLTKLISDYNYSMQDIAVGLLVPGLERVDIVVFQSGAPYIVINFAASIKESEGMLRKTINQAGVLNAKYIAVINPKEKIVYNIKPGPIKIYDLPINKAD